MYNWISLLYRNECFKIKTFYFKKSYVQYIFECPESISLQDHQPS